MSMHSFLLVCTGGKNVDQRIFRCSLILVVRDNIWYTYVQKTDSRKRCCAEDNGSSNTYDGLMNHTQVIISKVVSYNGRINR